MRNLSFGPFGPNLRQSGRRLIPPHHLKNKDFPRASPIFFERMGCLSQIEDKQEVYETAVTSYKDGKIPKLI